MGSWANAFGKAALRILGAFLLGAGAFVVGGIPASILASLCQELTRSSPCLMPLANHTGMLVVSFLLSALLCRGRIAAYGFRTPTSFPIARIALLSCGISAVMNLAQRFMPGEGLTFVKDFSFVQQIALMWVYASVAEEVLTRGLVQSFLAPLAGHGLALGKLRLSVPVLAGAVFFGAMHLMLFTVGVDAVTVLCVVVFAFAGGVVAGYYREVTGSLIPAIVAHGLFNATGSVVGLLWAA